MRKITSIIAASSILLWASCSKKDDAANPSTPSGKTQMRYKLVATNTSVPLKLTANGTIQWTSGTANPRLIKFEAKQGTSEIEYKSTNTAPVNLMNSLATAFGSFSLPAATYNEIELKIQLDKSGNTPALELSGQFTNTSGVVPVHFVVNDFVELKTEQKNVTVTGNASFTALTTFDLTAFSAGITESMIMDANLTGGVLEISSTSNTNIYNTILNNLKSRNHHVEIEHD